MPPRALDGGMGQLLAPLKGVIFLWIIQVQYNISAIISLVLINFLFFTEELDSGFQTTTSRKVFFLLFPSLSFHLFLISFKQNKNK